MQPDPEYFLKLKFSRMPYGKYKNRLLIDLPAHYIEWIARTGFPEGNLGKMLQDIYEIKLNGLEKVLRE